MNIPTGCRLTTTTLSGWRALIMENALIRTMWLPDKGADLVSFRHQPTGVEVLYQSHWGLQPAGAAPRAGSGDTAFQWNYEGGWQELFPSAHYACTYRGQAIPFHGEVATLPWQDVIVKDTAEEVAALFSVRCRQTPLRLERLVRLRRGEGSLHFEETITNQADAPAHFVWGDHCVVGAPFLEAGCRLEAPARVFQTAPQVNEATARLLPGQTAASIGLTGLESFSIEGIATSLAPRCGLAVVAHREDGHARHHAART